MHYLGFEFLLMGEVAEGGDAGFPEAAVAGHNLGDVRRSL